MFIIYREREITKIFNDMVESFKPDKRYEVGTLKDFILLVPETVHLDYTIDDGRCSVKKFVSNEGVIKIEGGSVTMSSTETTDSRLKFNNSVQITIQEGQYDRFTDIIRQVELNKYRVVVEDLMGNQFVMNVEFPAFVTHSVTFTTMTSPNTFTIGLSTESNFPTLFLESKISAVTTFNMRLCKYVTGRIVDFRMAQKELVNMIERDGKIQSILSYQEGAFKKIDSITNSFTYTESYDGEKYQQQLQFTIPLTEYKHYWQYNLVEFTDNRYAILIMTENGTLIGSGFEFGYIPSYVIETSEEVSVQNTIQITLVSVGSKPTADRTVDIDPSTGLPDLDGFIEDDDSIVFSPVPDFQSGENHYVTDLCINDTQSMYILLEETTVTGGHTGRYWCYKDYEQTFRDAGLNIVGTYDTTGVWNGISIVHPNPSCANRSGECNFLITPQKNYTFSPLMPEHTFTVHSDCDWYFQNIPDWLNFNVKSGKGGQIIQVVMTLIGEPEESKENIVNLANEKQDYPFTVRYYIGGGGSGTDCGWLNADTLTVSAQGGTVILSFNESVPPTKLMSSVNIVENAGLAITIQDNRLYVTIPQSTIGGDRSYLLKLQYDTGYEPCSVVIMQTSRFYRRVAADGYICDGNNKYQKIAVYWGDDEFNVTNFLGYEKGALLELNSKDCKNFIEQWVDSEGYICNGTAKYTVQTLQRSYDNGLTWEDTYETRTGTLVEANSSDCDGNYDREWRIDENDYICEGHTSYQIEREFISYDHGVSWHLTGETRTADPIRTDDPRCGGSANGEYRWVDMPGYICDGKKKYTTQKEQYSSDGGLTWLDTGQTRPNQLVEEDSADCDGNYDYKWEASDFAFVCDEEMTSYHIEYYLVSYDGGLSWHQTGEQRRDGKIMSNDPRCDDSGNFLRWMDLQDYYICEQDPTNTTKFCKYQRQKLQKSEDGIIWTDAEPPVYQKGRLIECGLDSCTETGGDGTQIVYRWYTDPDDYECVNGDKYHILVKQYSINGGVDWVNVMPEERERGGIWERDSDDCYIWTVVEGYICEEADTEWRKDGEYQCLDSYINSNEVVSGTETEGGPVLSVITGFPVSELEDWSGELTWTSEGIYVDNNHCYFTDRLTKDCNIRYITHVPDISFVNYISGAFKNLPLLEKADLSEWCNKEYKHLFGLEYLFYRQSALTDVNLDNLYTNNVDSFDGIFSGCTRLKRIPTGWNTDKAITMNDTFRGCESITNWDELKNWNIDNVRQFQNTFNNIETDTLDLSHWTINNAVTFYYMFYSAKIKNFKCFKGTVIPCSPDFIDVDPGGMFAYFETEGDLDCTGFNIPNAELLMQMFYRCKAKRVLLPDFNPVVLNNAANNPGKVRVQEMFYHADIEELDISSWDPSGLSTAYVSNMGYYDYSDMFTGSKVKTIRCKSAMRTWLIGHSDVGLPVGVNFEITD